MGSLRPARSRAGSGAVFVSLVFFSFVFFLGAGSAATAAEPAPRPYLSPWIVTSPGAERADLLTPGTPLSPAAPNAPGLLFDLQAPSRFVDAAAVSHVKRLGSEAARAGFRFGLAIPLEPVAVPTEPRAAEAATASTLYPGLSELLVAGAGADLFVLSLGDGGGDARAHRFALKKVAAEIRARAPKARIAVSFDEPKPGALFPAAAKEILTEEVAAYVDLLGLHLAADGVAGASGSPRPTVAAQKLQESAGAVALGKPLFLRGDRLADASALLAFGAAGAEAGAPVVAADVLSGAAAGPREAEALRNLGKLLDGDFSRDGRAVTAAAEGGEPLGAHRLVSGTDLGGLVLVPGLLASGAAYRGRLSLTLDAPTYASAEVVELATGRSKTFEIPRSKEPPRLSLSTANGPLAVKLAARERAPEEAKSEKVAVRAARGLTAEEILARHQAWRAARDARWSRLAARNQTSIRFRFADLNNTLDLTLAGPFFYEPGKGYDWAWSEAYFNGVRWKGKKIPELPLLQPEKVSELPLALTFGDAYRYVLLGEETVAGLPCHALAFEPKNRAVAGSLYEGTVWVSTADYAAVRVQATQINLSGEVQSVDETTTFTEVPSPDGGAPMRFPTRVNGQWIFRTFSRTTVMERETLLQNVRLDPPTYDAEKKAAYDSRDVMVRDTDKGVRYLEKTKDGDRVVVEDAKSARLFGLGGAFYDTSLDYPLPLLGVYYLDLDFRKKRQQVQVFFGGVLLAASLNEPKLFGSTVNLGVDVFGIAIRGTDSLYRDGNEDEAQRVKQRSFAANLNFGTPVGRHVKLSGTVGVTSRDYAEATETAPSFAVPSDHRVTRLSAQAAWDLGGYALSTSWGYNKRSKWEPWGYAGNADYDADKDTFYTYGATLAKDFHFPRFQRLRSSVSYLGSSNTDRFSKYGFGFFGGTSLRGFRSGSLRAEQAFVARGAYGVVVGDAFRVEGIYEHALVKDRATGLDWASFGGAGLGGQLSGPFETVVRFDVGAPVVGRSRGQKGFVVSLTFLKIF